MANKPFWRRSGPNIKRPDGQEYTPRALMTPCEAEGCEAFGSFGYKVNFGRGIVGHWYCAKHRHIGEALYHAPA